MQTRFVLSMAAALLIGSATIAAAQGNPSRSRGVPVDTYAPAARTTGVYTRNRQGFDRMPTGSIGGRFGGSHPTLADPYGNLGVPRGGESGGGGP